MEEACLADLGLRLAERKQLTVAPQAAIVPAQVAVVCAVAVARFTDTGRAVRSLPRHVPLSVWRYAGSGAQERHFKVVAAKVLDVEGTQHRFAFARNDQTASTEAFAQALVALSACYRAGGWHAPAGVDLDGFRQRGWLYP
jgi:hypothetical protein